MNAYLLYMPSKIINIRRTNPMRLLLLLLPLAALAGCTHIERAILPAPLGSEVPARTRTIEHPAKGNIPAWSEEHEAWQPIERLPLYFQDTDGTEITVYPATETQGPRVVTNEGQPP